MLLEGEALQPLVQFNRSRKQDLGFEVHMSSEVSLERGQIVLNRVPGVVGWSMAELASQRLDFGERRQEPLVLGLQHADGMDDRGEREGWTRPPRTLSIGQRGHRRKQNVLHLGR